MRAPVFQQFASTSHCKCHVLRAAVKPSRLESRHSVTCYAQSDEVREPAQLEAVEAVRAARLVFDDEGKPSVEYLACWKSDGACTWEPTVNLSEDLIRDFEESFWAAVKKGDEAFIDTALEHGSEVIASMVDADSRSALHFAAALNKGPLVQRLLNAGADPNIQDRDGYTPLHMAAGYLHTDAVNALLEGGADPSQRDRGGRNVTELIESLREKMGSTQMMQQRIRLEEVSKAMTFWTYEDVLPKAVLASRETEAGETQYLVSWMDDADDSWVAKEMLSEEVIADFNAGLEYAEAECLLDVRRKGMAREYLVRWKDSPKYPDSWESEDNLPRHLISQFKAIRDVKVVKPSVEESVPEASKPQAAMAGAV